MSAADVTEPAAEVERGARYAEGYAAGLEHCRRILERGREVGSLELAVALLIHADLTTEVCLDVLGRSDRAPAPVKEAVGVRH